MENAQEYLRNQIMSNCNRDLKGSIISLNDMTMAIKNRLDIDLKEARKYAETTMDVFGYDDRILDNAIERDERKLFYRLEEEGMLYTQGEEIFLKDGREWRSRYFILNKQKIFDFASGKITKKPEPVSEEPINTDELMGGTYKDWVDENRFNPDEMLYGENSLGIFSRCR